MELSELFGERRLVLHLPNLERISSLPELADLVFGLELLNDANLDSWSSSFNFFPSIFVLEL